MIAIDTETHPIADEIRAPKLVCMSTSEGELTDHADTEGLSRAYLTVATPLVFHNAAFDMAVLCANYPDLLPYVFAAYENGVADTMVRQKLIDIAQGNYRGFIHIDGKNTPIEYSLKQLAKRHINVDLDKSEWRQSYSNLDGVPIDQWPEGAREYAIKDAVTTLQVWEAQEKYRNLLDDQFRQTRAAFWLHLCGCWGIKTDPAAVAAFARAKRAEYRSLSDQLTEQGLKRPDRALKSGPRKGEIVEGARDSKAAQALVTKAFNGNPPKTDKGTPRIDEETCLASGDPLLKIWAEFSHVSKEINTDLPMISSPVVRTRFEELKESGRTGSSKPNIQNLPRAKGVRECFVPRYGYVFAQADYAGFELRTMAQCCLKMSGHSKLAEALNAGRDPHLEVASSILKISYEEALRRKKDKDVEDARQTGKVANFGFPGGLGAGRLCHFAKVTYGVTLTETQATELKGSWLRSWPEFREYFAVVAWVVEKGENIKQLFSNRFRGGCSFTEACNTLFQGLAADAAKAAGWLITKACYVDESSVLYGSRVVNFVHDEFILEVPTELGHECAEELARLMVKGADPWLPDVPALAEPCLMARWSKDAKTIRDSNGRLQVWR